MDGIGVMLKYLGGNEETVNAVTSSLNKVISDIKVTDKVLSISFTDGSTLYINDGGQSCCEHRYMTCDDGLQYYIGGKLLSIELKAANVTNDDDYGGVSEVQFLDINTDNGTFQIANHNEHNGYYGGFYIQASLTGNFDY